MQSNQFIQALEGETTAQMEQHEVDLVQSNQDTILPGMENEYTLPVREENAENSNSNVQTINESVFGSFSILEDAQHILEGAENALADASVMPVSEMGISDMTDGDVVVTSDEKDLAMEKKDGLDLSSVVRLFFIFFQIHFRYLALMLLLPMCLLIFKITLSRSVNPS